MPTPPFPSVTCMCLTRNRRSWLPSAIQCFLSQTYFNRKMLIVSDGEDISDLLPSDPADHRIALAIAPDQPRPLTVGMKRNLGCSIITTDLIAVFDDDDISAPTRLSDQIHRLILTGKAVTGYHSMRFTDGRQWWFYNGFPSLAMGTSLCFTKEWWTAHKFEDKQVGQDETFGYVAAAANQLISVNAGPHMHATIHSGNTSPRATHKHPYQLIE